MSFAQQNRAQGDQHHDHEKNEGAAVLNPFGVLILRNFRANDIDMIRQRHDRLEKEIGPMFHVPWHFIAHDIGGGEHDRSGFTGDARDAENG